jgi:hypothetical protein
MGNVRIGDIYGGMRNVYIEGEIKDMSENMIVLADETGRIFVRYRQQHLLSEIKTGNLVRVQNGEAVMWGGILQIKLGPKGKIALV